MDNVTKVAYTVYTKAEEIYKDIVKDTETLFDTLVMN